MKRYQMSESLPVGLLLALAGGILDSYTYLNRGQVFATAETGNLVLLGIHLAQGELGRVLSFVAGAVLSGLLTPLFGTRTVLAACLPLLLSLALMFRLPDPT